VNVLQGEVQGCSASLLQDTVAEVDLSKEHSLRVCQFTDNWVYKLPGCSDYRITRINETLLLVTCPSVVIEPKHLGVTLQCISPYSIPVVLTRGTPTFEKHKRQSRMHRQHRALKRCVTRASPCHLALPLPPLCVMQ
jgi:hypothetical protein